MVSKVSGSTVLVVRHCMNGYRCLQLEGGIEEEQVHAERSWFTYEYVKVRLRCLSGEIKLDLWVWSEKLMSKLEI